MLTVAEIKQWSGELGFTLCGAAPAAPAVTGEALYRYLQKNYHGGMGYMEAHQEKRIDPGRLMPGARSVICTATNYYSPDMIPPGEPYGKIARYGRFGDYHDILKGRLKQLAGRIREATGDKAMCRCFVDTAPVLEKAHAARAGLGWIGKNGLLLNERYGSWLLLGEIVTDMELEYDIPERKNCGKCTACMQACPGRAIVEPYVLDARRCISYHTIESKEDMPTELQCRSGEYIFGCDRCQDVCPYNQRPVPTEDPELKPRQQWSYVTFKEAKEFTEERFRDRFGKTVLERIDSRRLKQVISE